MVFVEVVDANDNSPIFEQNEYTFYTAEEQPPGRKIGTVKVKHDSSLSFNILCSVG